MWGHMCAQQPLAASTAPARFHRPGIHFVIAEHDYRLVRRLWVRAPRGPLGIVAGQAAFGRAAKGCPLPRWCNWAVQFSGSLRLMSSQRRCPPRASSSQPIRGLRSADIGATTTGWFPKVVSLSQLAGRPAHDSARQIDGVRCRCSPDT